MHNIICAALAVKKILLLLPEPVDMLVGSCLKDHTGAIMLTLYMCISRYRIRFLACAQHNIIVLEESKPAVCLPLSLFFDLDPELAVI